jgi:Glycosyl transferase family 11
MTGTIIARITGGLGNQLFIYAAARRIAQERNARLLLDTVSSFQHDKYGAIDQLGHFAVTAGRAPASLCFATPFGRRKRELFRALSKQLPRHRKFMLSEADFADQNFTTPLRDTIWLEGYWQSLRYFRPVEASIRRELTIISPLSEASRAIATAIRDCNAVCLHVRQKRGAALRPGMPAPSVLPQLPFSFYQRAVEHITQRVRDPVFFCFGDDADFLPKRWDFPYPVRFVTHNRTQETAYEDFALMTQCRHFIVANSTFSWWTAYLAGNPDKLVVAPKSEGALIWASEPDIVPESWVVLSS